VLGRIQVLQANTMSLAEARRASQWRATVRSISQIIQTMPLFRLQLLRGDQRIPFLYEEELVSGAIRLKPGVAYCLRKFSTLIGALTRDSWLREVRDNPRNASAMGTTQSLETFLFGEERIPLGRVRDVLYPVQEGRCFYCGSRLTDAMHVDHFVPWVLYPSNLGHNFVLADRQCNEDKSDLLADVSHLRRWCDRNETTGQKLGEAFAARGVLADLDASLGIARWAYERARVKNSVTWMARGTTRVMPAGTEFLI